MTLQDLLREIATGLSDTYGRPFGEVVAGDTIGTFLDREIPRCGDSRLEWRHPRLASPPCGNRVREWIIQRCPGFRLLRCPHCGAEACFDIGAAPSANPVVNQPGGPDR